MAARRVQRRRAGKQLGIWTPVQLVLMFVFGAGMAVATLYWMGIVSTTREMHMKEQLIRRDEENLRREAEEQAILLQQEWDEAIETVQWVIELVESEMEGAHLRDAAETLLALERVYQEVARKEPAVLEEYAETRLDTIVMPSLRLIYNVDDLGGEDVMQNVRKQLADLERQRAEQVQEHRRSEDR
jgi:hypothetical protein